MNNTKPELTIISQYLLGGVPSFHRNMLANMPQNNFEIKVIYLNPDFEEFTKSVEVNKNSNDVIFNYNDKKQFKLAHELSENISSKKGALVANFREELFSLYLFPKPSKTIYFICHDDSFIPLVKKYHYIIDIFITHNYTVYEAIQEMLKNRKEHIFFIPHGVNMPSLTRAENLDKPLNIVFLARHHVLKGIYDIPIINKKLVEKNIRVEWTILGNGNEREKFMEEVKTMPNFKFAIPDSNEEVLEILAKNDVYILPSRKDGLPVSLLEAMSVGCVPVISNFSEGIKKVVTPQIGYVLEVGNNDLFAEAICNLHINRNELELKSKNARNEIKNEYDIKIRAKQYFDLYENYITLKNTNHKSGFVSILANIYYFLELYNVKNKLFAIKNKIKFLS